MQITPQTISLKNVKDIASFVWMPVKYLKEREESFQRQQILLQTMAEELEDKVTEKTRLERIREEAERKSPYEAEEIVKNVDLGLASLRGSIDIKEEATRDYQDLKEKRANDHGEFYGLLSNHFEEILEIIFTYNADPDPEIISNLDLSEEEAKTLKNLFTILSKVGEVDLIDRVDPIIYPYCKGLKKQRVTCLDLTRCFQSIEETKAKNRKAKNLNP